jgi:hypothetical protein
MAEVLNGGIASRRKGMEAGEMKGFPIFSVAVDDGAVEGIFEACGGRNVGVVHASVKKHTDLSKKVIGA